jgi:tRNA threonylcarbamoyladenosine biosynthesis protein TsaE
MAENILLNLEYSFDGISAVVSKILDAGLMTYPICVLQGDLGAGKTTLVKEIIAAHDLPDLVTSPTFSIVNEYGRKADPIFHMDLYRLQSLKEVIDIGFEEYLDRGFCFIEWADLVLELLPEKYCRIEIENLGNFTRCLRFKEITI